MPNKNVFFSNCLKQLCDKSGFLEVLWQRVPDFEVQLHGRLCRQRWCMSDWQEAFYCQLNDSSQVGVGDEAAIVSQVAASVSRQCLILKVVTVNSRRRCTGFQLLPCVSVQLAKSWRDAVASLSAFLQTSSSVLDRLEVVYQVVGDAMVLYFIVHIGGVAQW